jgi:branched-chain amino acid transport system substrate-binding protein
MRRIKAYKGKAKRLHPIGNISGGIVMRAGSKFFAMVLFGGIAITSAHAAEPGITDTTIKLGAYDAVTGPIPLTGKQIETGWQTAVSAINETGGINGRKLELIVEDDQYEPSRSMAAARKLVERDQIFAMTGLGTPTSVVVAKYLNTAGVPLLFPMGASSTQLNQSGFSGLFMLHPAYLTQAKIITDWMLKNAGVKKPCIVYQLDPAGEDHMAGFKFVVEKHGIPLVAEPFERGTTDYSAPMLKTKNANCDMIYTAATLEAAARMVTAADRLGWRPKFYGFTTQADASLIKLLGPLAEGFYAADIMLPLDEKNSAVEAYRSNLKKYFPDAEPTFFMTYGYAAMMVIADALKQAGKDPTRKSLISTLESWKNKDEGLFGPVSFGPNNHDGKQSLYIIQVQNGKWHKMSDWYVTE